jgi:cytochrome c5
MPEVGCFRRKMPEFPVISLFSIIRRQQFNPHITYQEIALSQDKQFYSTFFAIMGGLAVLAVILIIIATNLTTDVSEYKPPEVVLENIKPVGRVNVAGKTEPGQAQAPAPAPAAAVETAAAPKSGEQIYNSSCVACHATGAAGAPKLGDAAAWASRIAAGMDSLLANAINGLNAMPPKGLCMACSEDEMKAVIEYIVNNSQ